MKHAAVRTSGAADRTRPPGSWPVSRLAAAATTRRRVPRLGRGHIRALRPAGDAVSPARGTRASCHAPPMSRKHRARRFRHAIWALDPI